MLLDGHRLLDIIAKVHVSTMKIQNVKERLDKTPCPECGHIRFVRRKTKK